MILYLDKIPFSQIFAFLAVGVIILLIFKMMNTYIIPLIDARKKVVIKKWGQLQILVWFGYIIIFFSSLFRANIFLTVFLSLVIFGLGWNFWTNVFSGIIIKYNKQFKVGDILSLDYAEGKLISIDLSHSTLKDSNGDYILIPNNVMKSSVVKHIRPKSNLKFFTFSVDRNRFDSVRDVKAFFLNCPYISANQSIFINSDFKEAYSVKASIIDDKFLENVKEYINSY